MKRVLALRHSNMHELLGWRRVVLWGTGGCCLGYCRIRLWPGRSPLDDSGCCGLSRRLRVRVTGLRCVWMEEPETYKKRIGNVLKTMKLELALRHSGSHGLLGWRRVLHWGTGGCCVEYCRTWLWHGRTPLGVSSWCGLGRNLRVRVRRRSTKQRSVLTAEPET